ncbi:hypothetical protein [Amantichitinum ursilacus]|uniref:Uncharacterized protein n=1 Tax=Amantichitinum ursilacus TaxID=857265 RepID=A0A0N0GKM6_9NEIS|nr:hypothetical protein [Amantichitinum ursilacus]KPC49145.1 hypothetical protein WG78_21535 [Amantichitinum ursilacus]
MTTKHRLLQALMALALIGAASGAMAHDHDDDRGPDRGWHGHHDHHDDRGRHDGWHGGPPPPPPHYRDDPRWHERARWDGWREAHAHRFVDWRPGYVYQPGQWVWYQGHAYEARVPVAAAVQVVPVAQPGAWLDISARIPLN